LDHYTKKNASLIAVFYFSAFAHWRQNAVTRHKLFVRALESTGVRPIMGRFKEKSRFCINCKSYYWGHEEKQTDVNMGIHLIKEVFLTLLTQLS